MPKGTPENVKPDKTTSTLGSSATPPEVVGIPLASLPEIARDALFLGAGEKLYSPETHPNDIPYVLPNNGRPAVDTVVYVNGIVTDAEVQFADMQMLANTGAAVIGIHNATGGRYEDVKEYIKDKLKISESKTVQTILGLVRRAVYDNEPLHFVAHSQGALMVACALELVRDELIEKMKITATDTEKFFSHIKVETYGGGSFSYIDGPQYVHTDNLYDPVSQLLGNGALGGLVRRFVHPGKGAVVRTIKDINMKREQDTLPPIVKERPFIDRLVHGAQAIYFKYRVPFEQARRGEFDEH